MDGGVFAHIEVRIPIVDAYFRTSISGNVVALAITQQRASLFA